MFDATAPFLLGRRFFPIDFPLLFYLLLLLLGPEQFVLGAAETRQSIEALLFTLSFIHFVLAFLGSIEIKQASFLFFFLRECVEAENLTKLPGRGDEI